MNHLKFEREVKIQDTVRKSKNIAEFSFKAEGDNSSPVEFEEARPAPVSTRFTYQPVVNRPPERTQLVQSVIVKPDEQYRTLEERNFNLLK